MKKDKIFKALIPLVTAIILFLIIGFAYFPEVLEGKQLGGHDNANFKGMARELMDFREETGEEALWSNNMFVGMPGYMTSVIYKGNKVKFLDKLLQAGPRPVSFIFLYLICFYFLLVSFRVNPWLAIVGAIAFTFSSYNFVIIAAGHNSKAIAIAYMAPVIAGIILAFRGRKILGMAITGLALALLINAGHPQITYYTLIIILFFGIAQLYFAIREKNMPNLLITVGLLIVSLGLGIASNASRMWTTMEYADYSMRSPSELTDNEADKTSGLTKSYATAWSYGIDETFSLLIPGFKGGSDNSPLSEKSATYKLFAQGNPAQASEVIKRLPLYWGPQTSTSGNIYVGATVVFLFILGMFLGDPRIKWWLFAVAVLGILLSWGKNFMFLTDFFMNHVPGYNKFRTVSMTLVLPAFAMPLLGLLTLNQVLYGEVSKKKLHYALKWSVGIAGGISLLFALFPDLAGNFISSRDGSYQPQLAEALQADRRTLLRTDAMRSLVFILLTAGLILVYKMEKINAYVAIVIVGVLFLADMWPVNKRYLNKDHFSSSRQAAQPYTPSPADQFIMSKPGYNNRVLNLSVPMFMDASTSFFHQSLGGYHGAKMRRYQDLSEKGLMDDINKLFAALQSQNYSTVDQALESSNVLNMVNTRYIIISPDNQPIENRFAAGNAWFVNQLRVVENADEEMAVLGDLDLMNEASLDRRYLDRLEASSYTKDSAASIELTEYQPNRMVYSCNTASKQLAVFSEAYYEKGWQAYLDGEKADHIQVDYMLRGMEVPEGTHEIVFEFHPRSYYLGSTISATSSILLVLVLLGALYLQYFRKPESGKLENEENSLITV